jgi:hypothetical protein
VKHDEQPVDFGFILIFRQVCWRLAVWHDCWDTVGCHKTARNRQSSEASTTLWQPWHLCLIPKALTNVLSSARFSIVMFLHTCDHTNHMQSVHWS